jgi:glycosyltransferase involved in cell wall biosynthesis
MITKLGKSTKTCVILYSRRHFNPVAPTSLENSSAGQIARSLYEELSKMEEYEVHYFDAFDHSEWKKMKVDLLVSLIDNLDLARWFFKPAETVVIAVNQHPLERLRLCGLAPKLGIPISALSASDGIFQPYKALSGVNEILCVGNDKTANSFRYFLKNCNITETFYSTYLGEQQSPKQVIRIENILILMSSIGYRKGFDRIYDSLTKDGDKLSQYKFHIIGQPEGPYWKDKVDALTENYSNVHFHGWVSNNTDYFNSLLNQMDVSLFPTREEGLVGSLLECIHSGVLSLHTSNSGLNNSLDELKLNDDGDLNLLQKLSHISGLDPQRIISLQIEQFTQMQTQMSNSPNIGLALRELITSGLSKQRIQPRKKSSFLTYSKFSISFFPIISKRVNLTYMRVLKAKVSITFPIFYQALKKLRNFMKFDASS